MLLTILLTVSFFVAFGWVGLDLFNEPIHPDDRDQYEMIRYQRNSIIKAAISLGVIGAIIGFGLSQLILAILTTV